MSEIWIDISADGKDVKVEGKSADMGSDCKVLTKEIEEALGSVETVKIKPEYHRTRTISKKVTA